METENKNIIVSLQLPMEIFDKVKQKAKEECTSVSYIIRKAILEDLRRNK